MLKIKYGKQLFEVRSQQSFPNNNNNFNNILTTHTLWGNAVHCKMEVERDVSYKKLKAQISAFFDLSHQQLKLGKWGLTTAVILCQLFISS